MFTDRKASVRRSKHGLVRVTHVPGFSVISPSEIGRGPAPRGQCALHRPV